MATLEAEDVLEKFAQIIASQTGKTPQEILKTTLPAALAFFASDMFTRGGLNSLSEIKGGEGESTMTALGNALDSLMILYSIE